MWLLLQGISAPVQQLVKSFYSASDPPTSYELWGELPQDASCRTGYMLLAGQGSGYVRASSRCSAVSHSMLNACRTMHCPCCDQTFQHHSPQIIASAAVACACYAFAGSKLLVVQQTDSCFVAVSKQRQLGIVAVNLPSGVLLASFSRPVLPTAALTEVQASCAAAFSGS